MLIPILIFSCNCYLQAVPSRIRWRRPLMVRQPYSVAVLSTGGRFTSFLLRRKAWLEVELPLERETEGFEKIPSLMGKSDASERNESSLSNCRVQLALSTKKDGMILEILLLILSETDIIYLIM